MTYWQRRFGIENSEALDKEIDTANARLQQIYLEAADKLVNRLVARYAQVTEGNEEPVSYSANRDTAMLRELNKELKRLGADCTKLFNETQMDAYHKATQMQDEYLARSGRSALSMDFVDQRARDAIRNVWSDDGTNWSDKVWKNTDALRARLEKSLTQAIALGEGAMALTASLMRDCSVSYSAAKRLSTTELAHVYNEASVDRMKEAGITQYEWLTARDARTCATCASLNGKRFALSDKVHIPPAGSHPFADAPCWQ